MKILLKITIIISLFALLFSCNEDELAPAKTASSIYDTPIGYFENNQFVFSVTKQSILETFKNMDVVKETGMTPIDLKVQIINNKSYLRIYGTDQSVATVALVQTQNDNSRKLSALIPFGGICKSNDCTSGGGCIPERGECSNCVKGTKPNGQPDYGDCLKLPR